MEVPLVSISGEIVMVPVCLSKAIHSFGLRIDLLYSHHLGTDILQDRQEMLGSKNLKDWLDDKYRPFNVLTFSGCTQDPTKPDAFKPSSYFVTQPPGKRRLLWQTLIDAQVFRPRNLVGEGHFGVLSDLRVRMLENSWWYCQF